MKLVSVIIPVYNVQSYIAATIQSVINQTYPDWELLLVDDGSTDESIEICRQFQDSRIKIIRQANRGVSGARNTGIRHAKGDYLAFLDGDDLWHQDKLAKHIEHLNQSSRLGLSFSRSAFIDQKGNALGIYQMPCLQDITPGLILCRNPIGNGSVPVIRREAIDSIRYWANFYDYEEDYYFDEQLHHLEDIECWLRIAWNGIWKVEGIPEALTFYRVNLGGASNNAAKQLASLEKMHAKTSTYAPELIAKWGKLAKAYQIRFQARRLVSLRRGFGAVKLAHRALATDYRILTKEPRRTLLTLAAAYSLCLLPRFIYQGLETIAMSLTGKSQKRKIQAQERETNPQEAVLVMKR